MSPRVRLYGHALGYASFSQVTAGFHAALEHIGELAGFVPVDYYDDEMLYPGGGAPISVNAGMPSAVAQGFAMQHPHRLLMLAPNSNRVPEAMLAYLPKTVTGLLTPSEWGWYVLRELLPMLPVHVVPHGVHSTYRVNVEARRARPQALTRGEAWRVLHLTSTNSERKGTKLLLEAWKSFAARTKALLYLVCRYEGYAELAELVFDLDLAGHVQVAPSDGMSHASVQSLFQATDVVCQPSRAEGFGLVPLEAKAAGVPVVMTDCTGHRDHARLGASVIVETGKDVPSDDMSGAMSPELTAEAIGAALQHAWENYDELHEKAIAEADGIAEAWSWENTTGRAMRQLIGELL